MKGRIDCYLCLKEFSMGDSIQFIKFDQTTLMVHDYCASKIIEAIERLKHETANK